MKSDFIDDTFKGLIEDSITHLHAAILMMFAPVGDKGSYDNTIGFLLHLSTELLFKAMLYERSGNFPKDGRAHDLEYLLRRLGEANNPFFLSTDMEEFIAKVKRYHQLRYQNTDKKPEHDLVLIEELEEFWALMLCDSKNIEAVISSRNRKQQFGIEFQAFRVRQTVILRTGFTSTGDLEIISEEIHDGDFECPYCENDKPHTH